MECTLKIEKKGSVGSVGTTLLGLGMCMDILDPFEPFEPTASLQRSWHFPNRLLWQLAPQFGVSLCCLFINKQ